MHLRPMHGRDLPDVADLAAETHLEDEIVSFVAPHRRKYYASYRHGFVRRGYARSLRPGWIYWVAETDEGDEPATTENRKRTGERDLGGRVVGYAAWTRVGTCPVARKWQRMNEGWFTRLESYLAELRNQYWAFFRLDWSEDSSNRIILHKLFDTTFDEDIFPEAWLLANLAVHPDYQRQGVGALLLKWGLDQAQAEQVPCGVESSLAGLRLYEKMGFRKIRDLRYGDQERETMAEMVWEPRGRKGHWFDRAKAAALDGEGSEQSRRPVPVL